MGNTLTKWFARWRTCTSIASIGRLASGSAAVCPYHDTAEPHCTTASFAMSHETKRACVAGHAFSFTSRRSSPVVETIRQSYSAWAAFAAKIGRITWRRSKGYVRARMAGNVVAASSASLILAVVGTYFGSSDAEVERLCSGGRCHSTSSGVGGRESGRVNGE